MSCLFSENFFDWSILKLSDLLCNKPVEVDNICLGFVCCKSGERNECVDKQMLIKQPSLKLVWNKK